MPEDSKILGTETVEVFKLKKYQSTKEKIKANAFKILEKLFKLSYNTKIKRARQQITETIINFIVALQMVTMIWSPNVLIKNWNPHLDVWQVIKYVSFDSICGETGTLNIYYYITVSGILFCIFCFIALLALNYFETSSSYFYFLLPRKILCFLTSIGFIPSLMILLVVFKYSTFSYDEISEYSDNISSSYINYGKLVGLFSVLLVIILLTINIFSIVFTSDIRHSFAKVNIRSRAFSKFEIAQLFFMLFQCIFFVMLNEKYFLFSQAFLFIYGVALIKKLITALPYYNPVENAIKSCQICAISISILIFLFSAYLDNGSIIAILNVFLQPFTLVLVCLKVKSNSAAKTEVNNDFINQYEFERKMRPYLCNEIKHDFNDLINKFSYFSQTKKFGYDKLLVIWEANYCFYVLKNEQLARVKLTKLKNAKNTLEGEIQQWLLTNKLDNNKNDSSEVKFLEYLDELNRVKAYDLSLCEKLLDVINEILLKSPKIVKLVNMITHASDDINKMKNLYENLTSCHKQICGMELYASFLQSILHNDDLSNLMLRKIETIKNNDFNSATFREENGILLVSVDSISFGEISYINDPALYILKTSRLDSIGKSFTKFIPLQYRLSHDSYIHEFIQNCTNPDVTNHSDLFLENDEGFIFECQLLIRFTPMHNKMYMLISINPLKTSRQMALISSEGIIQNHTDKFPYFLGFEGASLKSRNISEFVSNFSMHSMNTFEPKIEIVDNQEIALIHSEKIIKTTKIHTFTIIYSRADMHIWKRGNKSSQIHLNNNNDMDTGVYYCNWMPSINQKMFENIKSALKLAEKLPQIPIENNDIIDTPKDFLKSIKDFSAPKDPLTPLSKDRSNSASNNSQSNSAQRFVTKVIQESENRIKFFQSIFFFSVLAVALSNIGILIYIYDEVDHTSSLRTFEHLGEILYLIASSADLVVSINYDMKNGQLSESCNALYFNTTISQLDSLKDSIRTDYGDWSYCQSSDISIKAIIPVWTYENSVELKMANFYDAIQEFIIKGKDFILKAETGRDLSNEMKFIIKNSLGFMYEYSDSALEGLVNCEKDRISGQGIKIGAFLCLGVGIITLFLAFLIIQVLSINKRYKALWDTVMKVARVFGVEEKYILIERLAEVHGIDYASIDDNSSTKKSHEAYKKLSFKVLWRYAWRLSIFFLTSVTFYLVIYFVLYARCEDFMMNRPVILQTFTKQRALLSRMSLFARDINIPVNEGLFGSSYSFENPKTELVNSASLLNNEILMMRDSKILSLASENLKKRIFEYSEIDIGILKYGTISATNSVIFQAFSLGSGVDSSSEVEIHSFISDITQIQEDADINFGLANHESKSKIEDILGSIIQITIVYSIGSILVFIFFYWPFLISERNILLKIQNFSVILPAKIIFDKKKESI